MSSNYRVNEMIRCLASHSFQLLISRSRTVSWFSTALIEDAKIHRLLLEIPIGKMTPEHITDAQSLIFKWCEVPSFRDAERAEFMLNRLITETSDGGNHSLHLPLSIYVRLLEAYSKSDVVGTGPLYAHNLLQRMIERHDDYHPINADLARSRNSSLNKILPTPDITCFNTVLHGWANSSHPQAIEKIEELFGVLEQNITKGYHPQPNTSTYNILINAYANHASFYGYAQKAEDVLLKMANINSQNQSFVRPNTTSFNLVLKAWKNCKEGIECAQRAESILRLMTKLESQGHYQVRPDLISFCTVINAYGDNARLSLTSSDKNDVSDTVSISFDGALGIFHLFSDSSLVSTEGAVSKCLSALIDTMGHICQQSMTKSNSSSEASLILSLLGEKYIKVLDMMKQLKHRRLLTDTSLLHTLCHTILDYLQVSPRKSHENEHLFDSHMISPINRGSKMQDQFAQLNIKHMRIILENIFDGSYGISPDTLCVNRLLRVYNRLGDESAAETLYKTLVHGDHFSPIIDLTTFCIMADLFYQSRSNDSANKILKTIQDLQLFIISSISSQSAYDHRKINFCFNLAISKFCKIKSPTFTQHAYDIVMKRNEFSQQMGLIDIIHYNMVLSSFLHVRVIQPCAKALDILRCMHHNRAAGYLGPDAISFTHTLQILLKFGQGRHVQDIMKIFNEMNSIDGFVFDAMVFEHTLHALTSAGNSIEGTYAREVFVRMRNLNAEGKVPVTVAACNLFLKALSRSPEECHEALLQLIQDFKEGKLPTLPDRIGFNTVIHSWSLSKRDDAFKEAYNLLELMISLNGTEADQNLSPDQFTISTLLSVIINSHRADAGARADELMKRISKIPDLHIDAYVYNRHMSAWAKSSSKLKLGRVLEILRESQREGHADLVSFNTALNAFAHVNGASSGITEKDQILSKAYTVYDELCSSTIRPDDVTFTTMLRVISNLSTDSNQRDEKVMNLFKDYCRLGIVTVTVIKLLRNIIPDPNYRKTLFQHSLEEKMLDKYWTRNVDRKSVTLK